MELYDALWLVIPLWLFVDEKLAILVAGIILVSMGFTSTPERSLSPSPSLTEIHTTDANTSAPSSDDTTDWN